MLRTRVITALILGIVLLGALYLGGLAWGLFVGLVAVTAFGEYLRLWAKAGLSVSPAVAGVGAVGSVIWTAAAALPATTATGGLPGFTAGLPLAGPGGAYAGLLLGLVILITLATLVVTYPAGSAGGALVVIAGSVYIGWTLAHLVLLRVSGPLGIWRTLLVFGGVWATDVLAYFVGSLAGRHKLKPSLSPGKTVEGGVGGLGGGILAAWFLGIPLGLSPGLRLGLGIAVAVLGQTGDLAESALKRYAGAKDSGRLLPGHGGVLDRFDSTLVAAPLVYYILVLWAQRGGGF
ncbi:MAG: phosphatidate cytidylyltransferase [Firmicutes bacterium]|nr:phosphatidate cytidylyltransferase [Bacillota bacterium]